MPSPAGWHSSRPLTTVDSQLSVSPPSLTRSPHISDSQHHISIIQILFIHTRPRGPRLLSPPRPSSVSQRTPPVSDAPLPPLFSLLSPAGLCGSNAVAPVRVVSIGRCAEANRRHLPRTRIPGDRPGDSPQAPALRSELFPFESSVSASDRRRPGPGRPPLPASRLSQPSAVLRPRLPGDRCPSPPSIAPSLRHPSLAAHFVSFTWISDTSSRILIYAYQYTYTTSA
ncbi:hypothetical protein C8Q77DRAFT_570160 [Trametes polyzona]|nr:hypothetical protein C8Q77DRAFT_570160 [Trametes polyzona]